MTKRSALIFVVAMASILMATFDLAAASEFAMVTWLVTATGVLACVVGSLLWIVIRPFWAGSGFHDVESLFWIAFLALPITAWLMYAAIWNLLSWFES